MGRKKPDPQPQPYKPGPKGQGETDLLGKPLRPYPPARQPGRLPTPPQKTKKDFLSGLTHESGTKSLLKGMLKFFR